MSEILLVWFEFEKLSSDAAVRAVKFVGVAIHAESIRRSPLRELPHTGGGVGLVVNALDRRATRARREPVGGWLLRADLAETSGTCPIPASFLTGGAHRRLRIVQMASRKSLFARLCFLEISRAGCSSSIERMTMEISSTSTIAATMLIGPPS